MQKSSEYWEEMKPTMAFEELMREKNSARLIQGKSGFLADFDTFLYEISSRQRLLVMLKG